MWNVEPLLRCPYCHNKLQDLKCENCKRQYKQNNKIFYMYDPDASHWQKCMDQIKALFRLDYKDDWQPRHDDPDYPYKGLDSACLDQKANAAMFNVAKDMIGELIYVEGYALDVGAYNGWASCQLAKHKYTVALDTSDHKCYGLGDVPEDVGFGIRKVIADGCVLPFGENIFDIVFMVSSLHHMHDKLKALNEAFRVLKPKGIFIAFGDRGMPEELIDKINSDGIRDYEGPAYTESELKNWVFSSSFDKIEILPIKYSEHMENLGYYSLVNKPDDNNIIFGVKE